MKKGYSVLDLTCTLCGRSAREHIWRCADCDDPLPKDAEGFPILKDHDAFAVLSCPPALSKAN